MGGAPAGRGRERRGRKECLAWSPRRPICLTEGAGGPLVSPASCSPTPSFCSRRGRICCWHRVLSAASLPLLVPICARAGGLEEEQG